MPFQWGNLLRILEALSFWHASTHWFVKSLTIFVPSSKFGRLVRRKAFLLCKNPCGRAAMGDGALIAEGEAPAQRNFQRKFALRRVGSAKFVVPPTIEHSKVRRHARLVQPAVPGRPGVPEGPRPSVSEGAQRKPFPRVSFGQFLRGGSTPRFFAQLRSVGSNHPAGRSLPV